jgi:cytochrome b
MKNTVGTICFVVLGLLTFRLVYGAWPPFEGKFGEWLASDPRAGWSMVAAVVGGIVGALVGRAFVKE